RLLPDCRIVVQFCQRQNIEGHTARPIRGVVAFHAVALQKRQFSLTAAGPGIEFGVRNIDFHGWFVSTEGNGYAANHRDEGYRQYTRSSTHYLPPGRYQEHHSAGASCRAHQYL